MEKCIVVDARMGRGKTSAAIRYMTENPDRGPYLYVTPFLKEVTRVCSSCGFDEPEEINSSKLSRLRSLMKSGKNISTTHALYRMMPSDVLDLVKEKGYSLILDESITMVDTVRMRNDDFKMISRFLDISEESGLAKWTWPEYDGTVAAEIKRIADAGELYVVSNVMYSVMNPEHITNFKEVFVLTYLFSGGIMDSYFRFFDIPYKIVGIEQDDIGPHFSDAPDVPDAIDIDKLVYLVAKTTESECDMKIVRFGRPYAALSKGWFKDKRKDSEDIKSVYNGLTSFLARYNNRKATGFIWTTFKDAVKKICVRGRYTGQFLPINSKATNDYRDCTCVAYMANLFFNPVVNNFFGIKDVRVDDNVFALSEMLQFIWRSAIRDGKHINLYIPSKRMRDLFKEWAKTQCGETN